jgi:outer membrane murein-binding lipoprotein Lpp
MQTETCVACSKPLVDGGGFCPFCGTRSVPSSTTAAIDTYIQNKLSLELSNRLRDEAGLVREIGDKAEDIVWMRLRRYGAIFSVLLTCILGFIAFVGVRTLDDVSKRIEPVVSGAEQRAEAAKRTIEETATKVDSVKASLDQLSHDVEAQRKRVAERGSEVSQKLEKLDATADEAQKRGELYQTRSEELSRRLEGMEKSLESKVEQVSRQVDDISIRRAYPNLGQEMFVTYNGSRWKGSKEKAPNERWINIFIDPIAVGDFSADQLEKLMADLKTAGYVPLPGMFGVGGPYLSGLGPLGNSGGKTTVLYFKKDLEPMATAVCALVSKTLSIGDLKPVFSDSALLDDTRRFVIERSGLDLQLILLHPRPR